MTITQFMTLTKLPAYLSLSYMRFILNRILYVRKISARWISHILTDDQKKMDTSANSPGIAQTVFTNSILDKNVKIVSGESKWIRNFGKLNTVEGQ